MNKKKILALLVAFTMLLSSVAVFADGPDEPGVNEQLTLVTTSPTFAPGFTITVENETGPPDVFTLEEYLFGEDEAEDIEHLSFVRKALQVPFGTQTPEVRFEFNFEFYLLDGNNLACEPECGGETDPCLDSCRNRLIGELELPNHNNVFDEDNDPVLGAGYVELSFPDDAMFIRHTGAAGDEGRFSYIYGFSDMGITADMFPSTGHWVIKVTEQATAFIDCDGHYCDDDCDEDDECRQHVWGFDETVWLMVVSIGMDSHVCDTTAAVNPCPADPEDCNYVGDRWPAIRGIAMIRYEDRAFDWESSPQEVGLTGDKEAELQFLNQFVKYYCYDEEDPDPEDAALSIEKEVTGDAEPGQMFRFTLNLTLPVFPTTSCDLGCDADHPEECTFWIITDGPDVPQGPFTAFIMRSNDVRVPLLTDTPHNLAITGTDDVFYLSHGDVLYIFGLPMGTTYRLTEDYVPHHTATAEVTSGGTAPCTEAEITTTVDIDDTHDYYGEYLIAIDGALVSNDRERDNHALVINDLDMPPVTGVFLNNLPFIGLIVLAGAALAGFVMLKVRKSNEEVVYQ
ncbi:MAG: hypothetical protein FWC92_06630 [Defluviitaleaceae bacterium]|nr:hypothetical protein [Defluviitaleaceae bacterium]